ncbi:unnamed protein product [Bursaphelenchus okinawaensis]|uniref:UTP--glucose-1-phosphate uridylyltransferase n=1 Tax=Bursaphelenchus okinawaensis TaxID=465554 RepID=A0A811LS75_9BILA|nr:unnamed protein product [Bursaphelenchus okinawaensis]CAG9127630.1 unnamed protein product [Bursaphelenchus okinawaensis]
MVDIKGKLAKLDEVLPNILLDKNDQHVFRQYYEQFLSVNSLVDWDQLTLFDKEKYQVEYDNLPEFDINPAQEILKRVAVIKLNGGLGTTMGCSGPKSLIKIRDGLTFLEFAIRQNEILNKHYNSTVPLILMNSYRTEAETKVWLQEHKFEDKVKMFNQSRCPRIYADTLLPVPNSPGDKEDEGYGIPPGHGNVFAALNNTGLSDQLLSEGRDIIFVSNIDNTAATVDVKIASVIARDDVEYVMENTNKTQQDIKGGTLIQYEGTIKHLELPHVPHHKVDEFCSLNTFKTFNTNNIWVDLKAVKRMLETMRLEVLPNKKKLSTGEAVIQLESAIGGAIRNFELAKVVHVPRRRFLPVKKTQDLLVIMSNAFIVDKTGVLVLNPKRTIKTAPVVHLSTNYDAISTFFDHFDAIPDLFECESLKVDGDVRFGKKIVVKGNVKVFAKGKAKIEDDTVLEGDIEL